MDEISKKQPCLHRQNPYDDGKPQLPRMPLKFDRRKASKRIHSLRSVQRKNQNFRQGIAEKFITDFAGIRGSLNPIVKRLNAANQYGDAERKMMKEERKEPIEIRQIDTCKGDVSARHLTRFFAGENQIGTGS